MFKKLSLIAKAAMAGYRMGKAGGIDEYIELKIKNKEYDDIINDIYVITDDVIIGCGLRYAAAAVTNNGTYAIIKEKEISKINNKDFNDFIMAHEMGHIEEQFKHGRIYKNVRLLTIEYEADEYAAKTIGLEKAIKGLQILKQQPNVETNEIHLRILHLESIKETLDSYKEMLPNYKKDLLETKNKLNEIENENYVLEDLHNDRLRYYSNQVEYINNRINKVESMLKMYGY